MPVVTMPDGTPVDFGDLPPDQIRSLIARKFPDHVASLQPQNNASGVDEAGMIASAQPQRGNLNIGVQGAAKGTGELAFGIPDLVNTATNLGLAGVDKASQFVGGPKIDFRFPMPSEEAAKLATKAGEQVGITTTDPAAMSFPEKAAYNVNRFGVQTAGAVPALERLAVKRGEDIVRGGMDALPRFYDKIVEPYRSGAAGRTVAGDAAAAGGAGLGETTVQQYTDDPTAQAGGAIAGGVGGVTTLSLAEGLARLGTMIGRKIFGGNIDKTIPRDPLTGATTSKKASAEAASLIQKNAVSPDMAQLRLEENQGELAGKMGVLPTASALTEDPGLMTLERRFRMGNPGETIARDQKFQTSVRDTVDQIAPSGANPQDLQRKAGTEIDKRLGEAGAKVEHAQSYVDRTADVRRGQGDEVAGFRGQKPAASEALDTQIVDKSLNPMDAARRRRYDEVPNEEVSGQSLYATAQGLRKDNASLPPNARSQVLPEDRVSDFEKLGAPIRDEEGNIIGYEKTDFQTLNRMRPILSADKAKARAENAPPERIDNLRHLQETINTITDQSPAAVEANRFYNEDYAPVYGREAGEAYKFRQDVNKDRLNRTASPPSETAGRFLVAGSPERTQALQRIFTTMQDPAEAQGAARKYLMADLAEKNVIDAKTGALRPNALRNWRLKNQNTLEAVPGLQGEVDGLLTQAEKGERLGGKFADELRQARLDQKMTEDQINRSAFRSVVDADADKAVASIMGDPTTSGRKLRELIKLTDGDDAARTGLKAAVRDYIVDKATNTASEKLIPGDKRGPVSFAKLTNIFNEHEKELAEVFSPEEMNTLRTGHRALELAAGERNRGISGSATAENTNIIDRMSSTPLGKGIEAFARLKFGLLKAGGMKATARRLSEGIGAGEADEIARLVQRATVDPELMGMLLGRDVPIASPRWNSKLSTLLGFAELGRKEAEDGSR